MTKDIQQFISKRPRNESSDVWYIASPYSHPDPEVVKKRVKGVTQAVKAIIENNRAVVPFSPILYADRIQQDVTPEMGWYAFDLPFLARADRLIVLQLQGWETSMGITMEIAFALGKGIPISYFTLPELKSSGIPF